MTSLFILVFLAWAITTTAILAGQHVKIKQHERAISRLTVALLNKKMIDAENA